MGAVTTSRDRVTMWFDASAERIGEVGLVVVLAVVKAWNKYQDRRDTKRAGRRASDHDHAAIKKSLTRLEAISAELAKGMTRLTARVTKLERAAGPKEE